MSWDSPLISRNCSCLGLTAQDDSQIDAQQERDAAGVGSAQAGCRGASGRIDVL